MASAGVREVKNRFSEFLRRVAEGERITVTDRGRPVAVIGPPESRAGDQDGMKMVREGLAKWAGGRPRGSARPVKVRGKSISETVIEGRR